VLLLLLDASFGSVKCACAKVCDKLSAPPFPLSVLLLTEVLFWTLPICKIQLMSAVDLLCWYHSISSKLWYAIWYYCDLWYHNADGFLLNCLDSVRNCDWTCDTCVLCLPLSLVNPCSTNDNRSCCAASFSDSVLEQNLWFLGFSARKMIDNTLYCFDQYLISWLCWGAWLVSHVPSNQCENAVCWWSLPS
jgi:hypothetical protein